jgi:hypothetical protein
LLPGAVSKKPPSSPPVAAERAFSVREIYLPK